MPGSYSTATALADTALETLQRAYLHRDDPDVGALILAAQETIGRLKRSLYYEDDLNHPAGDDLYELAEGNSAI